MATLKQSTDKNVSIKMLWISDLNSGFFTNTLCDTTSHSKKKKKKKYCLASF